jgi:putative membrane-bound dehydrogenase-like protein
MSLFNTTTSFLRLAGFASMLLLLTSSSTQRKTTDREPVLSRVADITVPDGYTVEVAAGPDLLDYPMFSMIDETGRMFVFESTGHVYKKNQDALDNPQFRIKLLTDTNSDGIYDKSTIYADKVGFPQGGVFYKGSLYATSAPDLLKFTDTDNDGVADKREVLLTGWTLNVNANSLIGPFIGPDGWLYLPSAIMGFDVTTKEGKRLKGGTARIWRVRSDGSGLEWISAGGMNNPVELTFTEAGEAVGTETYFTEPQAGQRDALVYWTEGGVYPKPNNNITRDSLVRTGELMPVVSKYSRVAPSGIGRYRHTALGSNFKGNLFSAQFNTHRVLRHKLIREGASFRTEDEVFFSTKDEDFHPTDVLEDADGSLLVVETGGWFIQGCPLSQVSKAELQGSIYRVRRKDAPKVADPYGNQIKWSTLTPAQAAAYLTDSRPTVCDRATQRLVDLGDAAIASLATVLRQSKNTDARTKAVFALYRIGTASALVFALRYRMPMGRFG